MSTRTTTPVILGVVGEPESNPRFIPSDEESDLSEIENDNNEISPLELQKPDFSNFKYISGQGAGYTCCDISQISATFTKEKALYKFSLLSNLNITGFKNLSSLGKLTENLPNLEILTADNCDITSLVGVEFSKGIRSISLANNNLAEIPKLCNVNYLEKLDISNNKLDDFFSESLSDCYSLTCLSLRKNEIKQIDLTKFKNCLALKSLDFSYNQITNNNIVWPNGNETLGHIRHLNFSNNNLSEIPIEIPIHFPGIFRLDFERNDIEISPGMNIENLSSLQYLCEFSIIPYSNEAGSTVDILPADASFPKMSKTLKALIIFYLQKLTILNGQTITPEEKVDAENLFKPSLLQNARNDRLKQDLFDINQHKEKIPDTTLPNMQSYPIYVLTGPRSLMGKLGEIGKSSSSYVNLVQRVRMTVGLDDTGFGMVGFGI